MRIEGARQSVQHLPITPSVLATLRETARLNATHYSTMIEGNRLTQEQVAQVVERQEHFPGRERDEQEVLVCPWSFVAGELRLLAFGVPLWPS